MNSYQFEYAAGRPQMYDSKSRKLRAKRLIKTLQHYYGKNDLKKLRVLDVGSSTGILDSYLAPHFKKLTGIDIDKSAVHYANKKYKNMNLKFLVEDAMNLSFPSNSFDIVICAQVYEHVPDAIKLFSEINRVLKKGGVCYFAALNSLWPIEPHYNLPFLAILPKRLGNKYVKLLKKASNYYETPRSYWDLKNILKHFKIIDYTPLILSEPQKFGYQIPNLLLPIIRLSSRFAKYFTPTFFWLLIKR